MPRTKTGSLPSYRLYKRTGQAVVTIDGHDHYLGAYGSPESKKAYNRLIDAWLARQEQGDQAGLVLGGQGQQGGGEGVEADSLVGFRRPGAIRGAIRSWSRRNSLWSSTCVVCILARHAGGHRFKSCSAHP